MEKLWLIYWSALFFSFIFGIIVLIKKNKLAGLMQIILTIILPIWAFLFALKRDYLSSGLESNEIYFMVSQMINGNIEAIIIILLYIILIMLIIYNLFLLKNNKMNNHLDR